MVIFRGNLKLVLEYSKNVECYPLNRVPLIMDIHESHITLVAVEFCRSNRIVILALSPHTSNKLQPLDRTVFSLFQPGSNQS